MLTQIRAKPNTGNATDLVSQEYWSDYSGIQILACDHSSTSSFEKKPLLWIQSRFSQILGDPLRHFLRG